MVSLVNQLIQLIREVDYIFMMTALELDFSWSIEKLYFLTNLL